MSKSEAMSTYIEFINELIINDEMLAEDDSGELEEILTELRSVYQDYETHVKPVIDFESKTEERYF